MNAIALAAVSVSMTLRDMRLVLLSKSVIFSLPGFAKNTKRMTPED
jgi:hypothetical protein